MRFLLVALLWLAMAAPAQAAERILAVSPHACEILFAVGAGPDVVGVGKSCDYPPPARRLPVVGDHQRLYLEAALRLQPTLIVTFQPNLIGLSRLTARGVRTVVSNPRSLAEILREIRRLGRLSGHASAGTRLAARLAARLDALRSRRGKVLRAFYEVWPKPLITVGGGSYLTDALAAIGLANVFADVPSASRRVGVEAVLRRRPQIILVPDTADADGRAAFWRRWLGKDVRVLAAPADWLHRPGPRLIDGLEALQRRLRVGRDA